MGMNVDNRIPDGNDHLTIQSITAWISGECTANLQLEYEQHCVRCAECREQMAMISQSMQPDDELAQSAEFQEMLRIGEQAAMRAWEDQQKSVAAEPEPEQKPHPTKPEPWFKRLIPVWQPVFARIAAAVLLLAVGISGYRYWQSTQPSHQSDELVERAMLSMRQAWYLDRPIKTRVTGEFPYLPYRPTRGSDDSVPVNGTQLKAATVILNLEVAGTTPTLRAKHALGRLHLLNKDFDEAEKLLQEVVSKEPQNALAYVDLGSAYFGQNEKEKSPIKLLKASQSLTKAIEVSPKLLEAWFNLALCHEELLLFTQAKADWEQYLKLDSHSKWADEARERLKKLQERSVLREPQPDKIAEELRAAIAEKNEAALRRLLDENFTIVTELTAGRLMDDYLAALVEAKQPEAAKHHQLLQYLAELIRDTKGDHYFVDLLEFVERSTPARLEKIRAIRAQLQQSERYILAGDYKQSIKFAGAARIAAESIGDSCHTEAALYRFYLTKIEPKEIPVFRTRLLSGATRRRHLQMQARALLALSNQYGAERKFSLWLETSFQAQEIANRIGDPDLAILSLRDIGFAYSDLGDLEQGIKAHHSATQNLYAGTVNLRRACQTYVQFAKSLEEHGRFQEALAYQREALHFCQHCSPALYLPAIGRAGKYAALAGQTNESLNLFQQALTETERYSQDQSSLVDLYLSLGDALVRNQRFSEAESAYGQAKEKLGRLNNLYYLSTIQQGLAVALLSQGKVSDAEVALNKSVDLTNLSRLNVNAASGRSTFVSSRLNVYQSMVDFQYFYKNSPEQAFDFSEIYRNRELLDLLFQAQESNWDESKRDLHLTATTAPQMLNQIQQKLPANTQLIEYALTEKHLLIWMLDRERCWAKHVAITPTQLQTLVTDYLQAVREQHSLDSLNARAKELYRLLIQPVAEHLKPQQNLVIIPDGALNALPFAAIVNPDTQRYLLEDYILSINPSASILVELLERSERANQKPVKSILAVSDPDFDRRLFPKLARLPGASVEIREFHSLYASFEQLAGQKATKVALLRKAGNFDVLHFATHSVANAREPLLSSIVLAVTKDVQKAQSESLLLAHEIFRLPLSHTRLVILSSCNSLVSQQVGQNGLGGLAHAFFSAGVPTVIGSLWEVKDESTASLLAAFHKNWRTAGLNTGQALRQAQLSFLHSSNENRRHPIYWAAFHVSGNGITI